MPAYQLWLFKSFNTVDAWVQSARTVFGILQWRFKRLKAFIVRISCFFYTICLNGGFNSFLSLSCWPKKRSFCKLIHRYTETNLLRKFAYLGLSAWFRERFYNIAIIVFASCTICISTAATSQNYFCWHSMLVHVGLLSKPQDRLLMNQDDKYRAMQEKRKLIDRSIPALDYGKGCK